MPQGCEHVLSPSSGGQKCPCTCEAGGGKEGGNLQVVNEETEPGGQAGAEPC